ncbi:hypothetical protein BC941DRAFT_116117 [Chlamydoabsidia padenii]|nr:hypothetical protein BC941DRAFT_116117 [Chlamydoabsidia padenii]
MNRIRYVAKQRIGLVLYEPDFKPSSPSGFFFYFSECGVTHLFFFLFFFAMFSKIIDTLRNSTTDTKNATTHTIPDIHVERRSFFDDDGAPSLTTPYTSYGKQTTTTTTTNNVGTGAIGINSSGSSGMDSVFIDGRRRSSLFGYSRIAADDYTQKDLSSSWS